jgi:hypothetical protein
MFRGDTHTYIGSLRFKDHVLKTKTLTKDVATTFKYLFPATSCEVT